mmetsp:Transcript_20363/g.49889  ORF Transcript_20363/g.49889 Transcript_20363/m.49889 type:complete len:212 (+) Transcript_20363:421-1056(+)
MAAVAPPPPRAPPPSAAAMRTARRALDKCSSGLASHPGCASIQAVKFLRHGAALPEMVRPVLGSHTVTRGSRGERKARSNSMVVLDPKLLKLAGEPAARVGKTGTSTGLPASTPPALTAASVSTPWCSTALQRCTTSSRGRLGPIAAATVSHHTAVSALAEPACISWPSLTRASSKRTYSSGDQSLASSRSGAATAAAASTAPISGPTTGW